MGHELLCCVLKINTILYINYTSAKIKGEKGKHWVIGYWHLHLYKLMTNGFPI